MKKLRYLLSALLLLAGVVTSSAQYYTADEDQDQSDPSIVYDGAMVAFYSVAENGGYLNGEDALTSELTSAGVYTIEATGRNAEDGSPLWYIKQHSTGKYIRKSELPGYSPDGAGTEFALTESISEAMGFTILQNWPIESEGLEGATPRTISSEENQDLEDYAWVICTEFVLDKWVFNKVEQDSAIYTYLGASGYPMLSTLITSNCWRIHPITEASGQNTIYAAYQDYAEGHDPISLRAGIDPGCYGEAEIAAYTEVFNEVMEQLENYTYTNEQANELAERLKVAREALDASLVKFEAGKYYMFASNANHGLGMFLCWNGAAWNFSAPSDASIACIADAAYYFYAEDAGTAEDGSPLYHLKNFDSEEYITSNYADNQNIPGGTKATLKIGLLMDSPIENAYNIVDTNENAPNKGVLNHGWNGREHYLNTSILEELASALFTVRTLPMEEMEALKEALEIAKRNEELAAIVSNSKSLITSTKVYKPAGDCTPDGSFENAGIVTSASQLSSNADHNAINPDATDGEGFPGLLDGDVTTFFHSAWQNAPSETHFIDANLMQEVDGISLKLARRTHNNQGPTPVMFEVYASNDSVEWTEQGVLGVQYDYDFKQPAPDSILVNFPDSVVAIRPNWVGIGALPFNGNYKYVRLAVPSTYTQGGTTAYFYLSELRYYAGAVYDKAASVYEKAPQDKRTAFEAALAKAEAELAANLATQATISELRTAYEALQAAIPSTAELHQLIDSYTTLLASSEEGEGVGFYTVGSKQVFETVLNRIVAELNENWGVAEIAAATAELTAAYEAFCANFQLPEEGKLYALRPMSKGMCFINETSTSKCGQYITSTELYPDKWPSGYGYHGAGARGDFKEGRDYDDFDLTSSYHSLWLFEYNAAGDSVYIRNAATGFYIGNPKTTVTPHPFAMSIFGNYDASKVVGKNNFVFTLADGSVLSTNQSLAIVIGTDASSADAAFRIEEIEGSGMISHKANAYPEIISLPYNISSYTSDGEILEVIGMRTDAAANKKYIVLGQIGDDYIEAGKAFVYWPADTSMRSVSFTLVDEFGKDTESAAPYISLEGKTAYGMAGVVVGGEWIQPSIGRMDKGIVKATSYEYKIISHTGYVTTDRLVEVEGSDYELLYTGNINVSDIDEVLVKKAKSAGIYSIDGRFIGKSLEALPAGIYIVEGKKVMVK